MGVRNLPGQGNRLPLSTYRLQLGPQLSFDDVADRLDYYVALGVTDLYLSPILQAAPGSTHGACGFDSSGRILASLRPPAMHLPMSEGHTERLEAALASRYRIEQGG